MNKRWHLTSIKTSSGRLRDLMIYYKGDIEKAWRLWSYDGWQDSYPYGYKGERSVPMRKSQAVEQYIETMLKIKNEHDWYCQTIPDSPSDERYVGGNGSGIDGCWFTDEEWSDILVNSATRGHDISDSWLINGEME